MSVATEKRIEVSRPCPVCGNLQTVSVRPEDYEEFLSPNRRKVQDIFPYLSNAGREMFISGLCPDCWDEMFSPEGEEFDPNEKHKEDSCNE